MKNIRTIRPYLDYTEGNERSCCCNDSHFRGGVVSSAFAAVDEPTEQDLNPKPKILTTYLKKGVNLDYIFGNNFAYYYHGMLAYSPAVMTAMVTNEELNDFAAKGFDHLRVPIDPLAMGATSTNFGVPVSNNPGVEALKALIDRCKARNLRVVVDFHPSICSSHDYMQRATTVNSSGSIIPAWLGPYKKDYVGCLTAPTTSHPLVQFWSTFSQAMATMHVDNWQWVAFEIMNEPFIGFEPDDFGLSGTTAWVDFKDDWRNPSSNNWRKLQLMAIRAAQENLANYAFLATTSTSFPESYRGFPYNQSGAPFGPVSIPFPAYVINEQPSDSSIEGPPEYRIAYSSHVYAPFRYTHPATGRNASGLYVILREPHYFLFRDFWGQRVLMEGVSGTWKVQIKPTITSLRLDLGTIRTTITPTKYTLHQGGFTTRTLLGSQFNPSTSGGQIMAVPRWL